MQRLSITGWSQVEIDSRMMPHEWILTDKGIFKTDHLEHHSDQFFMAARILQDLAGFWSLGCRGSKDVYRDVYGENR